MCSNINFTIHHPPFLLPCPVNSVLLPTPLTLTMQILPLVQPPPKNCYKFEHITQFWIIIHMSVIMWIWINHLIHTLCVCERERGVRRGEFFPYLLHIILFFQCPIVLSPLSLTLLVSESLSLSFSFFPLCLFSFLSFSLSLFFLSLSFSLSLSPSNSPFVSASSSPSLLKFEFL